MVVQREKGSNKNGSVVETNMRIFVLFFCRHHICKSELVWSTGKNVSDAYKNIPKEMRPMCVHGPMHPPPSAISV